MKKLFFTILFLCIVSINVLAQSDVIKLNNNKVELVLPSNECSQVRLAADALCRDFKKVMEFSPAIVNTPSQGDKVHLVVVDDAVTVNDALGKLEGNEAHSVSCDAAKNTIYLHGADMRGTIYAIYSFSEEVLGVPPLWYWCDWQPNVRHEIDVPADYVYHRDAPIVRYRAWFPNDQDLFVPWRNASTNNNELWLETMLRLKLNTVEKEATVTTAGTLSSEAMLYKKYGLVLTSHHMVALNNSFANWDSYWRDVRKMTPPALSVKDLKSLKEFWQFSIDAVMKSGVENLWQVSFRGKTDQPFWEIFTDAPSSESERGRIISEMVKTQYDMICESTGDPNPFVRMTFYDEISSLLAKGYITPPTATNMLWTFVAGRRDHYPYDDLVNWTNKDNVKLGYYMNLQFYSTGAHLAPAEGPWKMEDNYRYVQSKGPLTFSVVNAGNVREFLMEMSANASMMWDSEHYDTNAFLRQFCKQYFGEEQADAIAQLYHDYYYSYWNPKKSDFPGGFDRQYVFQDLRHERAIKMINDKWNTYTSNPLVEIGYESVPGRTFRIEGKSQVDSILVGTEREMKAFAKVAERCDAIIGRLPAESQTFFYDHLSAYAHYMLNLSTALHYFTHAYKYKDDRYNDLSKSLEAMKAAKQALIDSQHGVFSNWYDSDDKFKMNEKIEMIKARLLENDDTSLAEELIVNYDFEYGIDGKINPAGNTSRGIPWGWKSEGQLKKGSNGLDSFGVNSDATNKHGNNVCWINSNPMPDKFVLYQTIPASKLTPGKYIIRCKLWVEVNKKTCCRLFANNNVQYYGTESDYTNLLTDGETVSYAGYAGGNTSELVLKDMEVEVNVAAGEDLTIGIKTGNKRNNGEVATDNAGWFKVDFFRIHREVPTDISSVYTMCDETPKYYTLSGMQVPKSMAMRHGTFIEKHGNKVKKIVVR